MAIEHTNWDNLRLFLAVVRAQSAQEAARRLGWVNAVTVSRPLVPEIEALRAELVGRGITRVVLAGMGGSSLAPEVIAATA